MPTVTVTQNNFNGGELSPSLYAAFDIAKHGNAVKIGKNAIISKTREIMNRQGLEFIAEVFNSDKDVRLLPFKFNSEQSYIVEAGDGYFRFVKDGAILELPANENNILETPYKSEMLSKLKYSQTADVVTICSGTFKIEPYELIRSGSNNWSIEPIIIKSGVSAPANLSGKWIGGSESKRAYKYKVTAIDKDGEESVPSNECTIIGEYEANWGVNEAIQLTWNAVEGAVEYTIYKCVNGVFGFLGKSEVTNFQDDKIEPDISSTPPIQKDLYEESGYPAVVANYQQRCIMANFEEHPQRWVASQVGNPHNFNVSRPVNASDAITVDLSEREINEIRHLVAIDDLIALTSGAEWVIKGSDGSFSANPSPVCTPQSYHGSSDIMPIISGNMILFVTDTRDCVRDLGYTITSDGYDGDELTTFASHLFEEDKIKEWAFQKTTNTVWCVLDSGILVSLLYDKRQEICGWTRHETDGKFISVASARENGADVLYFVVERKINGKTKKFIERMGERKFSKTSDCFFVDSGLSEKFENEIKTVGGLEHLEGKTVTALVDGGVVENLLVKNGTVELPHGGKKITVGLPYTFSVEMLPIDTTETVGKLKKITKTDIKIRKSREDFSLQTGSEKKRQPRSYESINDADWLKTGSVTANLFSVGQAETDFVIEQSLPLPICISSVTQTVTVETNA